MNLVPFIFKLGLYGIMAMLETWILIPALSSQAV